MLRWYVMKKINGFTLVELLVSLAVLAVLSTMTAPLFVTMLKKQNMNNSVQELKVLFSEARGKAVLERRDITVKLNSNSINTVSELNWHPSGKAVLKAGTSPSSIVFLMNGTINSVSDLNYEICDDVVSNAKYSKKIGITRMGVIQMITEGTCS